MLSTSIFDKIKKDSRSHIRMYDWAQSKESAKID